GKTAHPVVNKLISTRAGESKRLIIAPDGVARRPAMLNECAKLRRATSQPGRDGGWFACVPTGAALRDAATGTSWNEDRVLRLWYCSRGKKDHLLSLGQVQVGDRLPSFAACGWRAVTFRSNPRKDKHGEAGNTPVAEEDILSGARPDVAVVLVGE